MSNWLPAGSEPADWYYDPAALNGTDNTLTGTSTGHFAVPAMSWTIPDSKSKWAVPYDVEIDAALIKTIGMYNMEWNGSPVPAGWRHAIWISDSPGGSPIKVLRETDLVYGDQTNWWYTAPFAYPTLLQFVVPQGVYYICHELRDDSGTPVGTGTLTIKQRRIGANEPADPADYTNWVSAYGGAGGGFGLPAGKGYYYPKPDDADPINRWENSTTKELLGTISDPDYFSGTEASFYRRLWPMTKAHWCIPVTIGVEAAYVGASTLSQFDVNGSRYSGRVVFWWSDQPFSTTRKKIIGPDGGVKEDEYWYNNIGSYAFSDAILPKGTYYCNIALVGTGEGPDGTMLTVDSTQTISAVIDHRTEYNKEVRPSEYANWNVAYGSGLPDAEPPPTTTPPAPDPEPPQPPPTDAPPDTEGPVDDGGTSVPDTTPPVTDGEGNQLPIQAGFRGLTNFWDSLLITKDPKKKQIEVSFVNAGGANVGSDGPNSPDDTTPDSAPCLLWTNSYISDGWEVTDPSGKFFLTTTADDILEANPYTVPVNIDVYDDSFDKLTLEWTDANGTHTKRVNVIREPNVTPYVEDTIEFYVSEAQAQAMEGTAGVHPVGSVAITDTYTECTSQSWFGYFDAGDPCVRQYAGLPLVGDRPVYLSVSGCTLPPPVPDPEPSDGDDVPPATTTPECLDQDCQAYESQLTEGMLVATDSQYASLYGTTGIDAFSCKGLRIVNKYPQSDNPSITTHPDRIVFGDTVSSGPCDPVIRAAEIPSAASSFRATIAPPENVDYWYDPSVPDLSRPTFSVNDAYLYDAMLWLPTDTGGVTLFDFQPPYKTSQGSGSLSGLGVTLGWDKTQGKITMTALNKTLTHAWTASDTLWIQVGVFMGLSGNYGYDWEGDPSAGRSIRGQVQFSLRGDVALSAASDGTFANIFNTSYIVHGDNGNGIYPQVLGGATVLYFNTTLPESQRSDVEASIRRSLVTYVPPTYCERLP